VRGVVAMIGSSMGFVAVANLPLADSNALGFAEVLYTTLGAVLILHETVGIRRWMATAAGFVGVMVMLSPFGSGVDIYTALAVIAPAFGAATSIMVRLRGRSERSMTVIFWQSVMVIAVFAGPAAAGWVTPAPRDLALIAVIGTLSFLSQWTYTLAYQTGEASALAPMHFTRLLLAAGIGWIAFAEVPNAATMAGALLVVGATVYTLRRNSVRGVPPATKLPGG
jgi:drug/metabolite transporter (DMT)-like permease